MQQTSSGMPVQLVSISSLRRHESSATASRGACAAAATPQGRPDTPCSTARPPEPIRRRTRSSPLRSCASIEDGRDEEGCALVKPTRPIPAERDGRPRHRRGDVADAPSFGDVAGELRALLGDAVFVAHNVGFDLAGAPHAFARAGIDYRPAGVACTLEAFRLLEPLADNHRLQSICERRGIVLHGAHDALSDVLATVELLRVVLDEGIAPETIELDYAAYHRLRSRGDTRPASEPQIRRLFGMARSAGLRLPDGSVDRDQVVALVGRVAGTADVDALTRAQVQDAYDALDELIAQQAALAPAALRRAGLRRVVERARESAVAAQLPRERIVVDDELVREQLRARDCRNRGSHTPRPRWSRTAGSRVGLRRGRRGARALRPVLDLDRARPHLDQLARLRHPRQPQHGVAAELARQDRGERLLLLRVARARRRGRRSSTASRARRRRSGSRTPPRGRSGRPLRRGPPRRARRARRSRCRMWSGHP